MGANNSNASNSDWFVRMSNGTIFGPINASGLSHWAMDGRVMPDDEVSTDRTNWLRACDLDELGMDTMLELPDGSFKGPYHPQAIDVLAREGSIPMRAVRFHKRELEERMANRQISLFGDEAWDKSEGNSNDNLEMSEEFEQQLELVRQEAKDAIELAQREADDLRVERERLMEELAALQKSTANNQQSAESNQQIIDELIAEKAKLENDLAEAIKKNVTIGQQVDELIAEKDVLESELSEIKQLGNSNNHQNEIIQDLQNQSQLLSEQLTAAENERDDLAQKLKAHIDAQLDVKLEEASNSIPVVESDEYLSLLAEKEAAESALLEAKTIAEQAAQSLENAAKAHEVDVIEQQKLRAKIESLQEQASNINAELAVAKENNDLAKELLSLAEGAKKELTDALNVELSNVEEKTNLIVKLEENCSVAEQKAASLAEELADLKKVHETVNEELIQLKEEYSELLDFSNNRDSEHNEELAALKQQLDERPEVVQTRREQMFESQLKASMQEADILREQLENLSAKKMTEDNYTEDDISLIKRFADESINVLRKTLEEEKEANLTARAKSIERQRVLHEELQRLERVMQRDPGELTRAEMSEQRANKQIAKLQQELESERRHHQADVARAEANATALEQRYRMLMQKEAAIREQLSAAESRNADFDSVNNLLRRRENALLAAEKEFEEARQQWKMTEETLQRRIEELENGAGLLFDNRNIGSSDGASKPITARSGLSRFVLHK